MSAFEHNLGGLIGPGVDRNKTAFIDLVGSRPGGEGRAYDYGEVDDLANSVGRGLVASGLSRGDAVAILAENSVPYFATYMGILRAGMVAVPVNYRQPPRTIAHIISDSGSKLIFADQGRRNQCPSEVPVLSFEGEGEETWSGFVDPGSFDLVDPEPGETAMLLYTSGSTGMPKGVMLSHEGQLHAISRWADERQEIARHRLLIAAPQYHMNALFVSKLLMSFGASAVLLPRFDVETYIRAIECHQVTWLTGVPTMLALVVREKELLSMTDRSSVERVSMGSAPLTEALFDGVQAWFPEAVVSNLYGTTEHGPSAFGSHPDGLARPKLSLGCVAPGMELRLVGGVDENHGVLEVRSVTNMTGYKNLPEKTTEVMVDGWYHTKDVMRRDADGFYFIIGREDDMFVCNGENIFPGEVERLLESHSGIDQASVVPIPDPVRGQAPVAFVVRSAEIRSHGLTASRLDEAGVQEYALANGPAYQFPRHVFFLDTLPLAGTNKIDRSVLIEDARRRIDNG
ncbi:MAG: hypothetical protein CMM47_01115 [Rhodospirillaceae bacterium]|nr:hypothetical protein [Rhodospirillaceae bacterium]